MIGNKPIKVGIVGGTGYTGVELLRLLSRHPLVELSAITSRSEAGKSIAEIFPSLRGFVDLQFTTPDNAALTDCELIFFATPNAVAMHQVPDLLKSGKKIVDLSADFRIKDSQVWSQWYGEPHACTDLLEQAVYGLPELNRELIQNASLVANPGCYPTAIQLGLFPLLKAGVIDGSSIIADAKSGVSGAGRGAKIGALLCEASESFKAYGVEGHRHHPEIVQQLSVVSGEAIGLTFIPHLVPMIRGIHATIYVDLKNDLNVSQLRSFYNGSYEGERFVNVLPQGEHPATKSVYGSNLCNVSVFCPSPRKAVILSVIDNLVKGAAGQAVQNMNLMLGFDEAEGLEICPMVP